MAPRFKGFILILALSMAFTFCGAKNGDPVAGAEKPKVVHVGPVAPDIMGITITSGRVEYGRQVTYTKEYTGKLTPDGAGNMWIRQWGKITGAMVGDGTKIITLDQVVGERLDGGALDKADNFIIRSADDPDYGGAISPKAVFRKSRPTDLARISTGVDAPMEHTVYLKFPIPLKAGKQYTISFKPGAFPDQTFLYAPPSMRSEAVHVSHVGFRPDDPSKAAFLSLWMGSGGPVDFKERKRFLVVNDKTGETVFAGETKLSKGARDRNEDAYDRNMSGTDVYIMDFSPLSLPGTYRVYVEGVGCSYPFEIAPNVWEKAFYVSVRGLYHQRSGIEIGPPCSTFKRPRNFHPDDGVRVYASRTSLMDVTISPIGSGDGFSLLAAGRTPEIVPNAWGGYCDAGDWDRRIDHLEIARLLLDLYSLFPSYFENMSLNIPKSPAPIPDLLSEALWDVDFYKRLQLPDGAVRGGIESEGHPKYGEGSWQESWMVMAYAPDILSTYLYAATAARAAFTLAARDRTLSDQYFKSAETAMAWAENVWKVKPLSLLPFQVKDARNLAAAEFFRFTGAKHWHDAFLETTAFRNPDAPLYKHKEHDQGEAAWVYHNTDKPGMDPSVKRNCRSALISEADQRIIAQAKAGFRWAKNPWRPGYAGAFTVPDAVPLVRAHVITGKKEYLLATVLASQTGAGANPLNMSYTTGVGYTFPRHAMHIDSRVTGQAPPPGITVFGPVDVAHTGGFENGEYRQAGQFCYPNAKEWPVIENYWDVFWYPLMCEFTVHQTIAPNAYVWGYLAARK